jgi:hypothetical protein
MKKPLAVIAVVLIAFFALGFRLAHPQAGLSSALGSAKSSIVVYKSVGQAMPGDKVLIEVKGTGTSLGIVKSARAGTVDVDTVNAFTRVKQTEVIGKLVAIVPFFGAPLGWVGL